MLFVNQKIRKMQPKETAALKGRLGKSGRLPDARGGCGRCLKKVRLIGDNKLLLFQAYEKMSKSNMGVAAIAAAKRQAVICCS